MINKALTVGVLALVTAVATGAQGPAAPSATTETQRKFVGHWRLLKFENFDEKGVARLAGYDGGRIIYDDAGNMSAQLMRSERKLMAQLSTEAERAAAYATYTAYYGKYTIDSSAARVTHHVEGSVNPNWVKTDLVRYYAFSNSDNTMTLSIKNAEGRITGTLTWERLR
ncbi:MAG TPA: lipocalin-like domain-containing protein [Vicinamibacterales bacterium]|nr:lipocalin-like domain-containing protein [Vicinamibacterales bacterium]